MRRVERAAFSRFTAVRFQYPIFDRISWKSRKLDETFTYKGLLGLHLDRLLSDMATPDRRRIVNFVLSAAMLLVPVGTMGCGKADPEQANSTSSRAGNRSDAGPGGTAAKPDPALARAQALFEKGDLASAAELLTEQLIRNPDHDEARLLAGRVEAAKGNSSAAMELAESISLASPLIGPATNLLVQQAIAANQPEHAVQRLEEVLNRGTLSSNQAAFCRQQLWALFNRMGRRQEASEQADVLCRLGYLNRPLLISLLRRNESFPLVLAAESPGKKFYSGLGIARWFFSQGQFEQALAHLSAERETGFSSPAAAALYGRLLAETQATGEMGQWYRECDEQTRRFSDYWVALGIFFFDQNQPEASAGALIEGVYRDPTDDDACHRLARALAALNRGEDAAAMREHAIRVALLRELVQQLSIHPTRAELIEDLPEQLVSLGRPFESIGWALLKLPRGDTAKRQALRLQRESLRQRSDIAHIASEIALTQIPRHEFSMDEAIQTLVADADSPGTGAPGSIERRAGGGDGLKQVPVPVPTLVFQNVASQVGLRFQWYHAKEINLASIPLHEMMGGGICVCDYDLDGYPDVYFGQGSGDPPGQPCTRSNQLFRNVDGRFLEVTDSAAARDDHYSSGITAGDVNQDGFPDLYLGALGSNRLLINNGDGTFRDATETLGKSSPQFTSSVAIADLTGDAIPELFECVYVEMEGAFRLPDRDDQGRELAPNPNLFYPQADRWFLGNGDGTFEPRVVDRDRIRPATSLGLVITDMDADGSNDVFISNDARPN
ncbi:MAG: FG-GAP-like repeat-containing protein, partial [Pirellulales bacterium]|nr:FG-GAP-like repeat-containing protein [Pirellulales bacterium]